MQRSLRYRIREWFADRVKWVQYPDVAQERAPVFRYAMRWESRVLAGLIGSIVAVFSLLALGSGIFILVTLIAA